MMTTLVQVILRAVAIWLINEITREAFSGGDDEQQAIN
jgi:hypothetical protein